jgi:hypothetical protein
LDRGLAESGRTREDFTVEARLPYGEGDPAVWEKLIRGWQASGVSEFAFNPLGSGLKTPADHQAAIRKFAEAMGLSGR